MTFAKQLRLLSVLVPSQNNMQSPDKRTNFCLESGRILRRQTDVVGYVEKGISICGDGDVRSSSVWLDAAAPAEGAKEKEKGWGSAVTD